MRKTLRAKASKTKKKAGLICTAVLLGCGALGYNMYTNATSNAVPFLESGKEIASSSSKMYISSREWYQGTDLGWMGGHLLSVTGEDGSFTHLRQTGANSFELVDYNANLEVQKTTPIEIESKVISENTTPIEPWVLRKFSDGRTIILYKSENDVFYFDTKTNKSVEIENADARIGSAIIGDDGTIYILDSIYLRAFNPETGEMKSVYRSGKLGITSSSLFGFAALGDYLYTLESLGENKLILSRIDSATLQHRETFDIADYAGEAAFRRVDSDKLGERCQLFSYDGKLHVLTVANYDADHFVFSLDKDQKPVLTESETLKMNNVEPDGKATCSAVDASLIGGDDFILNYRCVNHNDSQTQHVMRLLSFGPEAKAYADEVKQPSADGDKFVFAHVVDLGEGRNKILIRSDFNMSLHEDWIEERFYPVSLSDNPKDGDNGYLNGGFDYELRPRFPLAADLNTLLKSPAKTQKYGGNGEPRLLESSFREAVDGGDFGNDRLLFNEKEKASYELLQFSSLDVLLRESEHKAAIPEGYVRYPSSINNSGEVFLGDGRVLTSVAYLDPEKGENSMIWVWVSYELNAQNPKGKILSAFSQAQPSSEESIGNEAIRDGDTIYLFDWRSTSNNGGFFVLRAVNLETKEDKVVARCKKSNEESCDGFVLAVDGNELRLSNQKGEYFFDKNATDQEFSAKNFRKYDAAFRKGAKSETTIFEIESLVKDKKGYTLVYRNGEKINELCTTRVEEVSKGKRDVLFEHCIDGFHEDEGYAMDFRYSNSIDRHNWPFITGAAIIDNDHAAIVFKNSKVSPITRETRYSQKNLAIIEWSTKKIRAISLDQQYYGQNSEPVVNKYMNILSHDGGVGFVNNDESGRKIEHSSISVKSFGDIKLPVENGRSFKYAKEVKDKYPAAKAEPVRVLPTAQPEPVIPDPEPETKPEGGETQPEAGGGETKPETDGGEIKPESKPEAGQDSKPWPKPAEKPGKKPGANKDKIENPKTADDLPMLLGGLATLGGAIFIVFKKLSNRR